LVSMGDLLVTIDVSSICVHSLLFSIYSSKKITKLRMENNRLMGFARVVWLR
jgi:hypothetical protein